MWNTALLAACGTTTIPSDATASHLDSRPVTHSVSHTGAHSADEATPTNILLLMIDDIGLDKINAYHEIEADVRTPTMDGLAAEGVLFRNAWGYPSCQAARGAFMTGRHARRTGLGRNWNYRVQGIEEYYAFPQEEVTLAEVVAASSDPWSSSFIGKWHLTTIQDAFGPDPVRQGWQYFSGTLENLQVSVTAG
ncbi:MAG: sulfatase-like hydrolase/transferase, partial [Alphaproteobacteria bacterium]|nr:sulfatase-like hydrolase/transferase [Alphaproteobacteria bacterium]